MLEYFGKSGTVFLEVVSIFPPREKKKTLQKAKKLFKVRLLSLSKDSLVNFLGENLSNFCQFILVVKCGLTIFSSTERLRFSFYISFVLIQNQAKLKYGKAKSKSQFSVFTDFLKYFRSKLRAL